MKSTSGFSILVSFIKPKYKDAAHGNFIRRDGKLYFKSGKDIVYIREHFPATGATPEKLVENTIRYDGENKKSDYLPGTLETEVNPCYNDTVNDVLQHGLFPRKGGLF